MYSIFLSRIEKSINYIKNDLKQIIKPNYKVAILPWTFPIEIDSNKLMNDFFKKGGKRYNRYINPLLELGINIDNIIICDCYKDSKETLKKIINEANVLLLPGGNPEMLYNKVVHDTEILYDIKYFKGIIIGESAGCELQLKRYFITAKNNYYKYFAFYDGFGVINDPFYMDVHSINNKMYLAKLQKVANETNKKVYAIFDDGAIILNRTNNEVKTYGNVIEFNCKNIIK